MKSFFRFCCQHAFLVQQLAACQSFGKVGPKKTEEETSSEETDDRQKKQKQTIKKQQRQDFGFLVNMQSECSQYYLKAGCKSSDQVGLKKACKKKKNKKHSQ